MPRAAVEEESFALIEACDSKFSSYTGEHVADSVVTNADGDIHCVRFIALDGFFVECSSGGEVFSLVIRYSHFVD